MRLHVSSLLLALMIASGVLAPPAFAAAPHNQTHFRKISERRCHPMPPCAAKPECYPRCLPTQ